MPILSEFEQMKKRMLELNNSLFIDPFSDDFFEVFTRKRMELIKAIMDYRPNSIRELAFKVQRDIKNVFDDLKVLDDHDIVDFEDIGRARKPIVKKQIVVFNFKTIVRKDENGREQ